jgi:hypothetical protein
MVEPAFLAERAKFQEAVEERSLPAGSIETHSPRSGFFLRRRLETPWTQLQHEHWPMLDMLMFTIDISDVSFT